ncbi:MAG: hypothetical protein COW01_15650 [Bdellovibrionales bacterium CG12_big_fil_rev_8_21_14_0_65_38_15]|nr:MAG: hypothetical protein COW79_14815 [Bdellovibrionales bacterium CG22_combo_CG10-13_8_21_14_all_38_13]PIQ52512.1 MAG: hypothetical protein COW01_15650 [Bdellovibrionales bacterium CG12_big_fil_rev_8_21_14_0_65_38_15]PIR29549.1 MAG: hypothetical protein COV38_10190 [Bdellovibrionales bacterium CG11_big_fil_rev_8_21_14_0_20_38_13]
MILKAKKIVDFSDWKEKPIQKAIQLFLLRPEPSKILTWFEDIPSLPPSVWWSAASLCGLFHGYRRLDSKYRGEKAQRELFTLYSLSFREITRKVLWPGTPESNLNWSRKEGSIFFNWGKVHLEAKKEHARGSWYFSNFENEDVLKKAKDIAIANNWDCLYNEISVSNKTIKVTGPGKINTKRNSLDLIVKGEIKLALPLNVKISEILDIELFKSFIALERVTKIAPPPPSFLSQKQFEEIPGLKYFPNFISENEEKNLISIIDNSIWRKDLHRRVQHYGWRYDYKAKTINESMYLGPLPSWAHDLATKLYKMKIVPFVADQVIVNEYVENQGISKHVDCVPCFEDNITTISLKESWEMVFRDSTNTTHKISKVLERRSATTISGPSRYRWTHEIPKRLKEPNGEKRGRRISITFRKVNQSNKIL